MANRAGNVTMSYDNDVELIEAVENRLREQGARRLTDEEIGSFVETIKLLGGHAPYDTGDVDEVLTLVGDTGPSKPESQKIGNVRHRAKAASAGLRALAESERRASSPQVVSEVRDFRYAVFGEPDIPFAKIEDMWDWVERQPDDPLDSMSFLHTVAYPGRHGGVARRQVQIPTGAGWVPSPDPATEPGARIKEDYGRSSPLGRLFLSARKILGYLGCKEYQATSLLLLGWAPYVQPISESAEVRFSADGEKAETVTLRVNYPWVSAELVRQAYLQHQPALPKEREKQRKATSLRINALLRLKDETPNLSWRERWERWNSDRSNWNYKNPNTMKNAWVNAEDRRRKRT